MLNAPAARGDAASEVGTGMKWIDGRTIYRRRVIFNGRLKGASQAVFHWHK